jgi:hypothetical protein
MSWNRLGVDTCYYAQKLTQNVSQLSYVMDTAKYQHCTPCRSELGLVGGNNVTKVTGNLVDLESHLFNIDKELSRCASTRYLPGEMHGKAVHKTVCYREIDTTPKHLKHCQFFTYPATQNAPPMDLSKC